jgi:hypothetical protein
MTDFLLNGFMKWFLEAILAATDAVFGVLAHGLLVTPDVTELPQVRALSGRSIWVVDTVFVLFFVAAGVLVTVNGGDERSRFTVKDLGPRLVVGFIAAHFSQLFCSRAIELVNGLVTSLTRDEVDDVGAVAAIKHHTHAAAANPQMAPLLVAVIIAIIAVLLAATTFSLVVRFSVLLVLAAAAPLALACHALPQTDPVARLWWRSFLGCLLVPVVQAFTLQAGQWMLLDPRHMLPSLPVTGDPGSVMNLFIVIVLLWTTVKVPGLVSRYVAQGRGGNNVAMQVVRVVVVQQGLRRIGLAGFAKAAR